MCIGEGAQRNTALVARKGKRSSQVKARCVHTHQLGTQHGVVQGDACTLAADCSSYGLSVTSTADGRECLCRCAVGYTGRTCDQCAAGFRGTSSGGGEDVEFFFRRRFPDGQLLETRQISKMISSYVGENDLFMKQYLSGELQIEFNPQGTLAERIRAGGAGIPAFFTKTGVGTVVADGKETREFDGETYVMERSLVPEVSLVKAHIADKSGNLRFRRTARNFNPNVAMAGRLTIVEVEKIVETGEIDPDDVHLPGIFVHRIVLNTTPEKRIEQRTVRKA